MKYSYNMKFLYLLSMYTSTSINLINRNSMILFPKFMAAYVSDYDDNNIYLNYNRINSIISTNGFANLTIYITSNAQSCELSQYSTLDSKFCIYTLFKKPYQGKSTSDSRVILNYTITIHNMNDLRMILTLYRSKAF